MFEDFQDSFSSYTHTDNSKSGAQSRPLAMFLLVFFVWIIFATVFLLVSLPKIKQNLQETNALEIIENRKEYRKLSTAVKVPLVFINTSDSVPVLQKISVLVSITGESSFHDAIEGLLLGPSDEALKKGNISLIPRGTILTGITVSENIAFVSFNHNFTNVSSLWGEEGLELAKAQVTETIKAVDSSIKQVIILVDGSEI